MRVFSEELSQWKIHCESMAAGRLRLQTAFYERFSMTVLNIIRQPSLLQLVVFLDRMSDLVTNRKVGRFANNFHENSFLKGFCESLQLKRISCLKSLE